MTPTSNGHRITVLLILAAFVAVSLGCSGGSGARDKDLTIQSRANPEDIAAGGFDRGVYSYDGPSSITVLLTDGPVNAPNRALIIRMFWKPKAAWTPLDETATNATVQYIVFGPETGPDKRRDVGIYSGGGFLYPKKKIDGIFLDANLWQATLTLSDSTEGFEDTLGSSILRGRFIAERDDEGIMNSLRLVNIAVSESLGVPRFVRAD